MEILGDGTVLVTHGRATLVQTPTGLSGNLTGEMRQSSGFYQVDGTDAFTVDLEPLYAHLGLPTGIRRVLSRNLPFLRTLLRPRRPAWALINEQTEFGLVSPETVTQDTNGSVVVTG